MIFYVSVQAKNEGWRLIFSNKEKIKEEEKYSGYYSIVTSELKMSDEEMRKVYRGLAKIEDSFKVTKTFFESRREHSNYKIGAQINIF